MENTLVLLKPDAVERNLVGRILAIYENQGLKIENFYKKKAGAELLKEHYRDHVSRDFYPELAEFMSSSDLVAVHVKGLNAISRVREINGATRPEEAVPGTIRHLFGQDVQMNCVHGSENAEEAKRELKLWFNL